MKKYLRTRRSGKLIIKHFGSLDINTGEDVGTGLRTNQQGVWTLAYGCKLVNTLTGVYLAGKQDKRLATVMYSEQLNLTPKDADKMLSRALTEAEMIIRTRIKRELPQHQFDALASFVFDFGYQKNIFHWVDTNDIEKLEPAWLAYGTRTKDNTRTLPLLQQRRRVELYLYKTKFVKFRV